MVLKVVRENGVEYFEGYLFKYEALASSVKVTVFRGIPSESATYYDTVSIAHGEIAYLMEGGKTIDTIRM